MPLFGGEILNNFCAHTIPTRSAGSRAWTHNAAHLFFRVLTVEAKSRGQTCLFDSDFMEKVAGATGLISETNKRLPKKKHAEHDLTLRYWEE